MNSPHTNISVWLIEDNTTFRRSLSRVINRSKELSCVKEFSSFEEADFFLNAKELPDVILLDIGLPGMNGIDALGEIRIKAPHVKVVVLTAFDDDDKIFRAICAGASGYLLKTSSVGAVASAIQEAFEGGAPMTPLVAHRVLQLLSRSSLSRIVKKPSPLTNREKQVLELLVDGLIKKEIATQLGVSIHTVSTHLRKIYEKLHVSTNTAAVAKAIREGII